MRFQVLPWAVTANVAFANTTALFHDTRFPKTGGGEDIDFCLQAAGGALVPVPQVLTECASPSRCLHHA